MPTYLKYEYIFFFISISGRIRSRIRSRIFFSAEPDPDPDPWKKIPDPHPWKNVQHFLPRLQKKPHIVYIKVNLPSTRDWSLAACCAASSGCRRARHSSAFRKSILFKNSALLTVALSSFDAN